MVENEIQGRGVGKKTGGCVSVKETRVKSERVDWKSVPPYFTRKMMILEIQG